MYKVFVNDKVICFTNNVENCNQYSPQLVLTFFSETIRSFVLEFLLSNDKKDVVVVVDDYETAFMEFQKSFKIIKAAGGIVSNDEGEKLFIYRLDKWDLPKGKIEKGEEIETAAIREIEEECGITDLTITKHLKDTFHIYKLNDQFILKQTYWFELSSTFSGKLVPQLEEDITKVEWLDDSHISGKVMNNTYASVRELLSSST